MNWLSCIFNRQNTSGDHTAPNIEGIDNVRRYSYEDLRAATGYFSPDNKVGQDAFGFVYKGTLEDRRVVAIKVISDESLRGGEEFFTVLKVIHDTSHENLVRLYGCCIEGDHRILIYDYFVNGNLVETLLGENLRNIQFSWRRRSRICIGVARGLEFLHEEVQPCIIHRDIKPANIFLDRDLTPKISGFELAEFLPEDESHVSTYFTGTLAPEQSRRTSDVFSFGVLLIEIVTGRRFNDKIGEHEDRFLIPSVLMHYDRGDLWTIVDASIPYEAADMEEACKFLKIGLLCIKTDFNPRPTMSTVLQMLEGERDVESDDISSEASDEVFTEARD